MAKDRMFGLPGVFEEYRCIQCGFVRLFPQPTREALKKYYPSSHYYSYKSEEKRHFFVKLRAFFVAHEFFWLVPAMPRQGERGKILDVGCGSGDTLAQLRSIGWDVYGLDVDAHAIKVAQERSMKNVTLGSYEDMQKYPDKFFDVIRFYHVIEHLDDPDVCLKVAYKKLKPGGEIVIGTPNVGSFIARIMKQYWFNLDCPRHIFLFTPKTLMTLLKKNYFHKFSVSFCSAGGWMGSIRYVSKDILSKDIRPIYLPLIFMLTYPFEWLLDRIGLGDIFVIRAVK